jgi:hypothetical protein
MGGLLGGVSKVLFGSPEVQEYKKSYAEKELTKKQAEALDAVMTKAKEVGDLGEVEYNKFKTLLEDPNATDEDTDLAIKNMMKSITGSDYDVSNKGLENIYKDVLVNSSKAVQDLTKQYVDETGKYNEQFLGELGVAKEDYTKSLDTYKSSIGKIDEGILAEETGKATAGISSAYDTAMKQLQGSSGYRGIAGSGIEQGQSERLALSQARDLASAYSQARGQARGISDIYNQQRLNASQMQYQTAIDPSIYNTQMNMANQQLAGNTNVINQGLQGIGNLYSYAQQGQAQGMNTMMSSASLYQGGAGIAQQGISNEQAITGMNTQMANQASTAQYNSAITLTSAGIGALGAMAGKSSTGSTTVKKGQ